MTHEVPPAPSAPHSELLTLDRAIFDHLRRKEIKDLRKEFHSLAAAWWRWGHEFGTFNLRERVGVRSGSSTRLGMKIWISPGVPCPRKKWKQCTGWDGT